MSHSAIANVPTMHSVYVNADQPGASHVQIATGQTGHHPVVISQRRHADPSSHPVNKSLCASTHWSPPCGWEVVAVRRRLRRWWWRWRWQWRPAWT